MHEQKEDHNLANTGTVKHSRRNILKGAGLILMGGAAGRISTVSAAPEPPAAPPLPWKWVKLDPMEAGTRTYHSYLKKPGG